MTITEPTALAPHRVESAVLHAHARIIGASLALWAQRDGNTGTVEQRQAANAAMDAIDALTRELHNLRSHLVREMRAYDDETGRRVDAMLAELDARRAGAAS